jgi:hypothetical protein
MPFEKGDFSYPVKPKPKNRQLQKEVGNFERRNTQKRIEN